MRELERQRGFKVCENLSRTNWEKFAAEASSDEAESDIDNAVDDQDPHGRVMPQQRAGQPIAQRDLPREDKVKQGRRVVYLPAGPDHHEYRQGIDPVTDAYPARMNCRASLCRGNCSGGHCGLSLSTPPGVTARPRPRMRAPVILADFYLFIGS